MASQTPPPASADVNQAAKTTSFWGRWLRHLYDWVMSWSERRHASTALAGISASESIFFPIPVDPLIVALGASKPKRAIWYSLNASVASVVGAVIGYALGFYFWEATQDFFFAYVFPAEKLELVIRQFQDNTFLAIFLAGFTPIPFKVFTIAGGVAHVDLMLFIAGAACSRTLRFGTIGVVLHFFGPPVKIFIDKYFERITFWTGVLIVLAVAIYKLWPSG